MNVPRKGVHLFTKVGIGYSKLRVSFKLLRGEMFAYNIYNKTD